MAILFETRPDRTTRATGAIATKRLLDLRVDEYNEVIAPLYLPVPI